jgi:hypothetical protein
MGNYYSLNQKKLSISAQNDYNNKTHWTDYYKLYRIRFGYFLRDYFGFNTRYMIMTKVPHNLLQSNIRHYVKEDDL